MNTTCTFSNSCDGKKCLSTVLIRSDTYKSITYIYNLDEFIVIHPTTFTNKVWSVLKEICFCFF